MDRKDFKAIMAFVRAGDTVIAESISRIARNTRELLTILSSLTEKGVEFVSLKENIDTTTATPYGRFMLTVFGVLAELERKSILKRQSEGTKIAKAEGKCKDRKLVAVNEAQYVLSKDKSILPVNNLTLHMAKNKRFLLLRSNLINL